MHKPRRSAKKQQTPVSIKPAHSVEVRHVQTFKSINLAQGYFDAYQTIKPYEILSNSSWSHLLNVYESMRVTRILADVWITNVSLTTPGCTSGFLFRDVTTGTPIRYYEQLIVEPGSQKGRMDKTYKFKWLPIEPSDYDFFDHNQFASMDDVKYGQINFAGAGMPDEFKPKCLIEYRVHYEFKSLFKPEAPPSVVQYQNQKRREQEYDSDSSIVTVERTPKPSASRNRRG